MVSISKASAAFYTLMEAPKKLVCDGLASIALSWGQSSDLEFLKLLCEYRQEVKIGTNTVTYCRTGNVGR